MVAEWWATSYPRSVRKVVVVASTVRSAVTTPGPETASCSRGAPADVEVRHETLWDSAGVAVGVRITRSGTTCGP